MTCFIHVKVWIISSTLTDILALFHSKSLSICLLFPADILLSSTKTDRGMGNIQKPFRNHSSPEPGREREIERFVSINGKERKRFQAQNQVMTTKTSQSRDLRVLNSCTNSHFYIEILSVLYYHGKKCHCLNGVK